jgi:hypothetical protein
LALDVERESHHKNPMHIEEQFIHASSLSSAAKRVIPYAESLGNRRLLKMARDLQAACKAHLVSVVKKVDRAREYDDKCACEWNDRVNAEARREGRF